MTPVAWIVSIAVLMTASMSTAHNAFDPANASIERLRAALDAGDVTSADLVRYYSQRIARLDKQGPAINALISLNPQALEQAMRADAESKTLAHKPLLHGIPFIAKDNYDTAGIPTSGGSAALKTSIPAANAFVIQRLLEQGAILMGKANMSELAASYGRLGYSSAGGLTLNPYNTARDVSGSSSGSAAAIAADFAAFALGTDTAGSIRSPASVAGLTGLRPTLGLVSRGGVIPLSLTFDTPGILGRNVRDVAIVLDAIAGPDPHDASTLERPLRHADYRGSLPGHSLRGARLGVISNFRGGNSEVDGVERATLEKLAALGAVLVPITLPERFETLWETLLEPVGRAEFKPQFERYLRTLAPLQPRTLAELIAVSESREVAGSAHPVNPPRLAALRDAETSSASLTDSSSYIRSLSRDIPSLRRQLETLMRAKKLRAFVFSTMSCPATPRFDQADPSYVCASTDAYRAGYIAAAVGFPEVSVPAGRIAANLPVGYSFMGLPYGEAQLLELADAFQSASTPAVPPPLP
jgi:amidase